MATHFAATRPHVSTPETPADQARTTALAPRGLTAFFVIAFAFSWAAWWGGSYLIGDGNTAPAVLVGSFGPMVAAVIVTAATQGASGLGALFRRYSLGRRGGILPYALMVLALVGIAASAAFPVFLAGAEVDEAGLSAALTLVPVQFVLIALAGGGNEELGWRGFALPRLQSALSPLAANTLLGGIWALWHAPLFYVAGTVQADMHFPAYALTCVGLSIIVGTVFNSARGGVLAATIAHAAINVVMGLKGAAVANPSGLGEIVMIALVAVILILATRGRLGVGKESVAAH